MLVESVRKGLSYHSRRKTDKKTSGNAMGKREAHLALHCWVHLHDKLAARTRIDLLKMLRTPGTAIANDTRCFEFYKSFLEDRTRDRHLREGFYRALYERDLLNGDLSLVVEHLALIITSFSARDETTMRVFLLYPIASACQRQMCMGDDRWLLDVLCPALDAVW